MYPINKQLEWYIIRSNKRCEAEQFSRCWECVFNGNEIEQPSCSNRIGVSTAFGGTHFEPPYWLVAEAHQIVSKRRSARDICRCLFQGQWQPTKLFGQFFCCLPFFVSCVFTSR